LKIWLFIAVQIVHLINIAAFAPSQDVSGAKPVFEKKVEKRPCVFGWQKEFQNHLKEIFT